MTKQNAVQTWKEDLKTNWGDYHQTANALKLKSPIATLIATVLMPIFRDGTDNQKKQLLQLILKEDSYKPLALLLQDQKKLEAEELITKIIKAASDNLQMQEALNYIILDSDGLSNLNMQTKSGKLFIHKLLQDSWSVMREPSGVRIVVEKIVAGGNVNIAARDISSITQHYQGNEAALKSYLVNLLAEWNRPDLSRILPKYGYNLEYTLYIHQLFTPLDIWRHNEHEVANDNQLTQLRFSAVNQELNESRRPVMETIAAHPYLVIAGAAGTGKSYLARYVATSLAYACDPESEKHHNVKGIRLLGSSWIHGAILPLYVPLRNFAASSHFPKTVKSAGATHLLKYICEQADSFGAELENYLNKTADPFSTAILILDGLDEVNRESDRIIIQRIIEMWADRFKGCRVLVTSRTYAYKQNAKWRLSPRFKSAELAPFSFPQIRTYIKNWYKYAAIARASSFGGKVPAQRITQQLAQDLCHILDEEDSPLLPMMRQPLLLAMLTLIHETNKKLPEKTAELYEETIDLLNRWNPVSEDEQLFEALTKLNNDRMLNALKLAAFNLQCKQESYQKYPGSISRDKLRKAFMEQDKLPGGLNAPIEGILDYLGTRNGVLLSDKIDTYRFPHLSIQEYLAACSLIELYDECNMPDDLKPEKETVWTFPENLIQLLSSNPFQWRNVALFVGAIISGNTGQDGRWSLIEELIPITLKTPLPDAAVFSIYIAGEIWDSGYLKARLRSHNMTGKQLIKALKIIRTDDRLDAPERERTAAILVKLEAK